jgi:hypothetical protein
LIFGDQGEPIYTDRCGTVQFADRITAVMGIWLLCE